MYLTNCHICEREIVLCLYPSVNTTALISKIKSLYNERNMSGKLLDRCHPTKYAN